MKLKLFIILAAGLFALPTYAADTAMEALTDGSATVARTDHLIGYATTGPAARRYMINSILALETDPVAGALTGLVTGDGIGGLTATDPASFLTPTGSGSGLTGITSSQIAPPTAQSVTCTDSGDGNPGALTITPTAGQHRNDVRLTVSDANGCNLTLAETAEVTGTEVTITNISAANTATIATSAGVQVLTQGSPFTIAANESIRLLYTGTAWLESGRSTATISGVVVGGLTASKPVYSNSSGQLAVTTGLRSIVWNSAGLSTDGTQCAAPASAAINSGAVVYSITCTDNDAGSIYGNVVMPDDWDASTVTFELTLNDGNADPGGHLQADVACQCRGDSDAIDSTFGTEIALDIDLTGAGYVQYDLAQGTTAAVTCNTSCAAGDMLIWRYQVDATGTDATVANLKLLQMKMEYGTTGAGD